MDRRTTKERATINPTTGWYNTNNGTFCENCGYKKPTKPTSKGIWDYGVRSIQVLQLCKDCEEM